MTTAAAVRAEVAAPAGVHAFAPPVAMSPGPLGAVQTAQREIGRQTALRARAVAEFARSRPSSADRQPGEPGCASAASRAARPEILEPVSEWAAQELVVALSLSHMAATALLSESLTLVDRLPSTLDALQAGALGPQHLRTMVERVGAITDPAVRATVESQLLAWMAGQVKSPAQLTDKARQLVLRHDARGAAQRLAKAVQQRGVFSSPGREDGMSALIAVLTTPEARACLHVLGQYADAIDDDAVPVGDSATGSAPAPRTRAQKMADCLVDLVLRPGETDLPVVQAQLTLVATVSTMAGGDQPGEINGQVVPAEVVRQLARSLRLVPGDPHSDDAPTPPATAPPATATHDGRTPPGPRPDNVSDGDSGAPREDAESGVGLPPAGWSVLGWAEQDAQVAREAALPPESEWVESEHGDWPGEDPPLEVQQAWWERDAAWAQWIAAAYATDPPLPPDPEDPPTTDSLSASAAAGTWAAADAAIAAASDVVEAARRAVTDAARAATAAERGADREEAAWTASAAGRAAGAHDSIAALAHADAALRASIADLLTRSAGGGLSDRPRVAVVDALSGTLLALTDADELRRAAHCGRSACARRRRPCTHDLSGCPGLDPPGETSGYRPGAGLDRFVRARDRRCRFPGCRGRVPRGGELDHDRRWPDGPTAATNLAGYCTRNHRGKHQAPGWRHHLHADGRLTVITPTGLTTTTRPSSYDFATQLVDGSRQAREAGAPRPADPAPF